MNITILQAMLRSRGVPSDYQISGKLALKAIQERIRHIQSGQAKNYRIILSDYSMPEMNGPGLALAIRSLLQDSVIPRSEKSPYLCCVTAYASPSFE